MSSKKTDYVNAQFDDAEIRIRNLYDKIMENSGGVPVWIHTHNGGTYQGRFCLTLVVYKKKKTYLKMYVTYLPKGHWDANYWHVTAPEWATPPVNIDRSSGGIHVWWYPDGDELGWEMGEEISEDATADTIVVEYEW